MTRLKLFVMALLLSCLAVTAQVGYGVPDSVARARAVEYYYLQARSYMEQDSIDRCFEMLEHCRALDPGSLSVMYDLSSFYAFLNKDSVAHDMLTRIVDADPTNKYYNKALVNYYHKVGNTDAAIGVYEKMLEGSHSKSDIYIDLFSLYSEKGYHEKAIDMLEKLEKIEGTTEDIVINKMRHYLELGDSARTMDAISGMIKDSPDDLRYQTLMGNTYMVLGDRKRALEVFEKVLSVKPDDVYTLNSLADYYASDENDSLYCNTIERLLKSEALDTETRINVLVQYMDYVERDDSAHLASFMREMYELPYDEYGIALAYVRYLMKNKASSDVIVPALEKAHALVPDDLSVIVKLLEYAVERNDLEAVYKYSDNAQLYCPDKLEVYYYKGLASYLLGRKQESIEIYKEGLEKCEEGTSSGLISSVYALLGDTYHAVDMIQNCMQAYDSALVYDDSNVEVLNNYAYFLALAGKDLNRAQEMSQKTLAIEPENPTYIDTYAWVLFKQGRYEEAKAYADKLLAFMEEVSSSDLYHHCGDIYAKCGNIEQAVNFWIMAREAGDDSRILAKKIRKRKYYSDAKSRK